MRTIVFVAVCMALVCGCLVARPTQISQASIAATGLNRAQNGFPFTISQPGSYQLTSNLTVPANFNGIVIAASNVTLDLNDFTITCLGPINNGTFGIIMYDIAPALSMITVRNGGVVGSNSPLFFGVGLSNSVSPGSGITVQDLTVSGGTNSSIVVDPYSILRHNIATGQIFAWCPSIITESVSINGEVGDGRLASNPNANCILWNNRGTNFNAQISQ